MNGPFCIALFGTVLTGVITYNAIKLNYRTIRNEQPQPSCIKSFVEAVAHEDVSLPMFVTFAVLSIFFYTK
jgi:hypothetical protein